MNWLIIKKIFATSMIFSFVMVSMPTQSRADLDIARLAIVTLGSAIACGVVADSVSDEENKGENTTKAALFCGSVAAASFAFSSNSSTFGQNRFKEIEQQSIQFALLARNKMYGAGLQVKF